MRAFFCMAMILALMSAAIAMEEKSIERRNSRGEKSIEKRNSRRFEFGEMQSSSIKADDAESKFSSNHAESKKGKTCIYAWEEKCGTDAKESSRMNDAGDVALDVIEAKRIISVYTSEIDTAFLLQVIAGVPVDERAAFSEALAEFANSKTDLSDASSLDLDRVDVEKHDALIALLNSIRVEKLG